jgi:hypothetical protein
LVRWESYNWFNIPVAPSELVSIRVNPNTFPSLVFK